MTREAAVRELARLAVDGGISDPGRRRLLLFGIAAQTVSRLALHARPLDQVFSDLMAIHDDPEAMYHWFENAELLLAGQSPAAEIAKLRIGWAAAR